MPKYWLSKNIKYIISNEGNEVGGVAHSLCDYLTAYIISKIDPSFIFLHKPLETTVETRTMNVNTNPKNFWNDYLNLDELKSVYEPVNKKYKKIKFSSDYHYIEIDNLKKMNEDNTIYTISNNNRIHLFDLYQYELSGIIKKNTTISIINDLRNIFYKKHLKLKKDKKIINLYIRRGDHYKYRIKRNIIDTFEFEIFEYVYPKLDINNYDINIISAGSDDEMIEIKKYFSNYKNINLLLNQNEEEMFYLMTQSDLLMINASGFPLTASLYCDGTIIKKKDDNGIQNVVKFKNIKFFDNYYFINNVNELNNIPLKI
jgi:hypothetical protein